MTTSNNLIDHRQAMIKQSVAHLTIEDEVDAENEQDAGSWKCKDVYDALLAELAVIKCTSV